MKVYLKIIAIVTLIAFSIFSLNGCATVFKGSTDTVNFASEPDSADLYVNGSNMGKTPTQLELASKDTYTVDFKKEGYKTKTMMLNHSLGAGWLVLDIVFLLLFIPLIVDAATGNWNELDTNFMKATLEKE